MYLEKDRIVLSDVEYLLLLDALDIGDRVYKLKNWRDVCADRFSEETTGDRNFSGFFQSFVFAMLPHHFNKPLVAFENGCGIHNAIEKIFFYTALPLSDRYLLFFEVIYLYSFFQHEESVTKTVLVEFIAALTQLILADVEGKIVLENRGLTNFQRLSLQSGRVLPSPRFA